MFQYSQSSYESYASGHSFGPEEHLCNFHKMCLKREAVINQSSVSKRRCFPHTRSRCNSSSSSSYMYCILLAISLLMSLISQVVSVGTTKPSDGMSVSGLECTLQLPTSLGETERNHNQRFSLHCPTAHINHPTQQ